jgi:NDP-sugar pyrophosphorylase family protein
MTAQAETVDVAILCGGMGLRLRAAVPDRPKPMARVGDRPFLALLVEHVARFGFRRFILCAGYMADAVEAYFREGTRDYEAVVSREDRPAGTGGALRLALDKLRSAHVLALNGDSFCPVDYGAMLASHVARGAAATLAVARADDRASYGNVEVGADGAILGFREKQAGGTPWVNAGVYVFRREAIGAFPGRTPLSLEVDVFPSLAGQGLFAHEATGPILDIGTPERYERAKREMRALMRQGEGT